MLALVFWGLAVGLFCVNMLLINSMVSYFYLMLTDFAIGVFFDPFTGNERLWRRDLPARHILLLQSVLIGSHLASQWLFLRPRGKLRFQMDTIPSPLPRRRVVAAGLATIFSLGIGVSIHSLLFVGLPRLVFGQ